jgi:MFS family permease
MLAGAAVGAFLDRIPPRLTVGGALAVIATGLLFMLGVIADTGSDHLIAGMIVTGVGCGIALPALGSLAVDVAPAQIGVASGVNNTALQLGFALSIAVDGAVLGAFSPAAAGFADALNHMIAIGAATALVGAATAVALLRPGLQHRGR